MSTKTCIVRQDWKTSRWTIEDSYWREMHVEDFATRDEALRHALKHGYVFADVPTAPIAISINVLLNHQ